MSLLRLRQRATTGATEISRARARAVGLRYGAVALVLGLSLAAAAFTGRRILASLLVERTGGWARVMCDTARTALEDDLAHVEALARTIADAPMVRVGASSRNAGPWTEVLARFAEDAGFTGYGVADDSGNLVVQHALGEPVTPLGPRERPLAEARARKTARAGLPYRGRDGRAHQLVVAPLDDGLFLVLGVDIERLTATLRSLRPLFTGEVYAFDGEGWFVSGTRFAPELRQAGLLGPHDEDAVMAASVRDPGVDLRTGARPAATHRELPLTLAAERARAGETGHSFTPYRDYRGVPVIGAWTWMPDRGLGIAAEFDGHEALYPLVAITWSFGGLSALVLATTLGTVLVAARAARQQQRAARAEREAERLGSYVLEERIGVGGMGEVFRASHALLRRPTAVKTLRPELLTPESLERFEREVRLTATLSHPNTVAIYDYGRTDGGVFYYAMEYLDGLDLERLVSTAGPLPEERVIHLLRQVCGSLAEAHGTGLVHRDIKPANLFVCRRGGIPDVVKVLDFGLVKAAAESSQLTRASLIVGTPENMAPELFESAGKASPASDVYALGCTAYVLLTGQRVFAGTTVAELCKSHLGDRPRPPSERLGRPLDAVLEALVLACLAKNPKERPGSAEEVIEWLDSSPLAHAWTRERAEAAWSAAPRPAAPRAAADAAALSNAPTAVA